MDVHLSALYSMGGNVKDYLQFVDRKDPSVGMQKWKLPNNVMMGIHRVMMDALQFV